MARRGVRLNCFSPPVMLATFIVELVLAAYSLWRYRWDMVTRLAVVMVVSLAAFQISEYFVCGGASLSAVAWARTGYVAITLLPPLGIHLLHVLAAKPQRRLVYFSYLSAALFIGYFLSYHQAFTGYACTGNYVIFQLAVHSGLAYGAYYYGWLMSTLFLAVYWLREKQAGLAPYRRQTIAALLVGYLVFLVPTAIANTVKPETRQGIPSVMCGFAVLFALILVFYILPRVGAAAKAADQPSNKVA